MIRLKRRFVSTIELSLGIHVLNHYLVQIKNVICDCCKLIQFWVLEYRNVLKLVNLAVNWSLLLVSNELSDSPSSIWLISAIILSCRSASFSLF